MIALKAKVLERFWLATFSTSFSLRSGPDLNTFVFLLAKQVMILVDDAGGVYPHINHAPWNGITLADFVMPFFLFIVGVAMALVFKRVTDRKTAMVKAAWRALKLLLLGILLQGGFYKSAPGSLTLGLDLTRTRLCGVLQRIAFAYVVVAFCEISVTKPARPLSGNISLFRTYSLHWFIALILAFLYMALTLGLYVPDWDFTDPKTGQLTRVHCNTRGDLTEACNSQRYIDSYILGLKHLYPRPAYTRAPECSALSPGGGPPPSTAPPWCRAPYDPEGLLSSLAAVLSCFIGMHFGHVLVEFKSHRERLQQWVAFSCGLTLAGIALHSSGFPVNKMLYSLSYVLVTGGAAGFCFSLFYALIDVGGIRWPFLLLEWMGMNALLVFVLGACTILEVILRAPYWRDPKNNLIDVFKYRLFQRFLEDKAVAFLLYVILKILLWCVVSGVLHRKRIYWRF